jgi:hypothetical protein
MALYPFMDLGCLFTFLIYTQSVGPLGRGISPSQSRYLHRTAQTQNKRTQTSMRRVGFEPTIPVFERAKAVVSCLRLRGHCDSHLCAARMQFVFVLYKHSELSLVFNYWNEGASWEIIDVDRHVIIMKLHVRSQHMHKKIPLNRRK